MSESTKISCSECARVTNHDVLQQHRTDDGDAHAAVWWWESHQIIRCRGCDTVSFRRIFGSSEDFDPYTGEPEIYETLYPDRDSSRSPVNGVEHFPSRTRHVYTEVLKALNSGTPILAAIGLRAVIESVCNEHNVPGRNLEERIDGLADAGMLSRSQADFLHKHRFLGNVAAHEVVAPKPTELVAALDIAETLLKTLYVLPGIADSITTGVKPRLVKGSTPAITPPAPTNAVHSSAGGT